MNQTEVIYPTESQHSDVYIPHYILLGSIVLLLSLTGSATNLLSFFYFSRRKRGSVARNVTMFLNSVDFLVCIWSLVGVITFIIEEPKTLTSSWFEKSMKGLRNTALFVAATGYATCLLSVTRTISLVKPLYRISGHVIVTTNSVFLIYFLVTKLVMVFLVDTHSLVLYVTHYLAAVEMSLVILTVSVCCVLCTIKLISSNPALGRLFRITPANRHGTVTIIIISTLFCVVHLVYLLINVVWYRLMGFYHAEKLVSRTMLLVKAFSSFVGIPLNSALNPLVYITRQSEMRRYVRTIKVFKCWSSP